MQNNEKISPFVFAFAGLSILIVLILIASLFAPKKSTGPATKNNGQSKTTQPQPGNSSETTEDHFIIKAGQNSNIADIKIRGEEYYRSISVYTGLPSGQSLGLDKITIQIFANKDDYIKETAKPSWSEGFADYKNKVIFLIEGPGMADSVLPHELSHLFFDTYMAYENDEVNWIDEGLATLVQVKYDKEQAASFKNAMEQLRAGQIIQFNQLKSFKLDESTSVEKINLYYAQSLSLVYYLRASEDEWKTLLKKLKSGVRFDIALKASYDIKLKKLMDNWSEFIKNNKQSWE